MLHDILSGIGKIIDGLSQLTYGLGNLISYIFGAIFFGVFGYLILIRPLVKGFREKGKRTYWFGLFFFVMFLLLGCPALIGLLGRYYGDIGMFIGIVVFIVVLIVFAQFGKKYEKDKGNTM